MRVFIWNSRLYKERRPGGPPDANRSHDRGKRSLRRGRFSDRHVYARAMRLRGRDEQTKAVESALDAGDFARPLLIVGEAGIGKSALIAPAAERASERGMRVLVGRAAEHEGGLPFGLVVAALDEEARRVAAPPLAASGRRLAAVLPSARGDAAPLAAAGPGERFRYHRALRSFVELLARETPTALLLD